MTWEIVAAIITLLGAFGLVASWVSKLSSTLAKLESTMITLNQTLQAFRKDNKESHKEFYDKLEDHEERIIKLETKDGKSKN